MGRIKSYQAFGDLGKIDYQWNGTRRVHRRAIEVMRTPRGERTVKIVARSFNPSNYRYFMGVAYQLFDHVDEWVFWFEKESALYVLPDGVVSRVWRISGCPISESDQWAFNFHIDTGLIEGAYTSLRDYRHELTDSG
ncbi:MAG: hypothetical protein IH991_13425 [Planctomycetes bacterium]|nr:hypothetical protein [Planctomycetota bacterium]